jgi:hypothetical protein
MEDLITKRRGLLRRVPAWELDQVSRDAEEVTILERSPGSAEVETKKGKETLDLRVVTLLELVPEAEIPEFWKKTLEFPFNQSQGLVVVWAGPYSKATALVCGRTLKRLQSVITTKEVSEITLWEKEEVPSEGKPSLENSQTAYVCGGREIALPEDPTQYQ